MGIEGFNALFKEQCPEAYGVIPLTSLRGRRIAIDAGNLGYRWYAGAIASVLDTIDFVREPMERPAVMRRWLQLAFSNLMTWMRFGVTPVLVFDGTAPVEKQQEQARRREGREKTHEEITSICASLDGMDFIDRNSAIVLRYKSLLKKASAPSNDDKEEFRVAMETLGIPCVTSKGDGESLCSMMAIDGIVHGVYSTDTDCLVYGCPCLITEISVVNQQTVAHAVQLDLLLRKLEWSHSTFVDMCIMMSCDYNTNIPKIGPKRAFKLIQDHRSIDSLPSKLDTTPLNHVRCRELFSRKPSEEVVDHTKISRTIVRILRAESAREDAVVPNSIAPDTAPTVPIVTSLSDLAEIDEGSASDMVFARAKRLALATGTSASASRFDETAPPSKRRIVLSPSSPRTSPHPELEDLGATRRALHCLEIDVERFRLVGNELLAKYNCGGLFDQFLQVAMSASFITPRSIQPYVVYGSATSASSAANSTT